MINISANIAGHALMLWSPVALPTGSIAVDQLELAQVVGEEWAACATVTAQFWIKPTEIYEAEFENNVAVIPQEVLSGVGLLHIAVYGSDAGGTKRISTNTITMPITQGSFTEASAPAPSASLFEQAVSAAVEEVKDEILAPNAVDNEILSDMPPMTVKGNNTNQTGDPKDISADDFRTMFAMVGASAQRNGRSGFVPTPPTGGNTRFLCVDGTWKVPSGGGGGASSTDDVTINLPDTVVLIGPVADGDSLSVAMAQINNLINAVDDLGDDKLDTNGDGSAVTAQRNASIVFGDIPVTPITMRELLNRLGGWYAEINGKSKAPAEVTVTTAGAVSQACENNTIYTFTGELTSLTLTEASGAKEYIVIFTTGSTAPNVTFPSGVEFPSSLTIEASTRYEISVRDGYAVAQSWAVSA